MGDFFANLGKMFSGEEPAAAPEGSTPVDVTDGAPAPISSAKGLNVTAEQIEGFAPDEVIAVLKAAISTSAGGTPAQNTAVIETCCKRLRVLCREPENCKKCDEAGTASAVVASSDGGTRRRSACPCRACSAHAPRRVTRPPRTAAAAARPSVGTPCPPSGSHATGGAAGPRRASRAGA